MLETAQFKGRVQGDELGNFLNLKQAYTYLGITRGTVFRYVAEKKLTAKIESFGEDPRDPNSTVLLKFDLEELNRFKELMKKRRKKGQKLV